MPQLKSKHKQFIVINLACFNEPKEVQKLFQETFAFDISPQQIAYYDPDRSPKLSKKWRHMFADVRQKYIEEVSQVPIANKGYRLNELQKMFNKHTKRGNMIAAAQILEQAAKEVGGAFESMKDILPNGRNERSTYQQINNYIYNRLNNDNSDQNQG